MIAEAHWFIDRYAKAGIGRERVLIKLATTWEGIQAAKALQAEGIDCNMTLLFSMAQASSRRTRGRNYFTFVRRNLDRYKKSTKKEYMPWKTRCAIRPGDLRLLQEVRLSHRVMGPSFRSKGEVLELAGCDLLTISPELLAELKASNDPVTRKLSPEMSKESNLSKLALDEKAFRWMLNENAMATEKLSEGIRTFASDAASSRTTSKKRSKLDPGRDLRHVLVSATGEIDDDQVVFGHLGGALHHSGHGVRRFQRRNNSFQSCQLRERVQRLVVCGVAVFHPLLIAQPGVFGAHGGIIQARRKHCGSIVFARFHPVK